MSFIVHRNVEIHCLDTISYRSTIRSFSLAPRRPRSRPRAIVPLRHPRWFEPHHPNRAITQRNPGRTEPTTRRCPRSSEPSVLIRVMSLFLFRIKHQDAASAPMLGVHAYLCWAHYEIPRYWRRYLVASALAWSIAILTPASANLDPILASHAFVCCPKLGAEARFSSSARAA
jgi:hypothetical protein